MAITPSGNGGVQVVESVKFFTRKTKQKYSVFIRDVTIKTKRTSGAYVGFQTRAAAEAKASELSASKSYEEVEAVGAPSGLWRVTYVSVTETRTYGEWYIPVGG